MAYDGSIIIKTDIDSKDLKKQLSTIKSNISSGMKAVGKATTIAMGAVSTGIGAIAGASVKISETTDNIDKMSQKIGISRESYQEWDFVLSQFGANVDGLQTSMKTLSAAADDVATGGKTYTEQFDKLGVSITDVNGNMKDQETLFNEVFTALQGVEDETTRTAIASDLLGKSATELAPALNAGADSIDDVKQQAHDLGLVLSDETVDAGVMLTDTMDQLKRTGTNLITNLLTPMIQPVNDLLQAFVGLATGVEGSEQKLAETLSNMATKVVNTFIDLVPKIFEYGVIIIKSLINGIVSSFPNLWNKLEYGLGFAIGTIIRLLPEFLSNGKNIIENIKTGIAEKIPELANKAGEIIRTIIDYITNNSSEIVEKGKDILKWIYDGAFAAMKWALNIGIDIITNLLEGLGIDAGKFNEKAKEIVEIFLDGIRSVYYKIIDIAGVIIENLIYGLTHPGELIQAGVDAITSFLDGIKSFISNVYEVGVNIIATLLEGLGIDSSRFAEKAHEIINYFIEGVKSFHSNIINVAGEIIKNLIYGLTHPKKLINKGKEILSNLKDGITEKISSLFDIGGDIIDGLVNGIKDGLNKIKDTAKKIGNTLLNGVKGILGIHSPSKEMAKIGGYVDEGFSQGIEDGINGVKQSAEDLAETVPEVVNNSTDDAKEAGKTVGGAIAEGVEEGVSTVSDAVEDELDDTKKLVFSWTNVMNQAFESVVNGFSDIGEELANNEFSWKSFGRIALQALADVLKGIAVQLAGLAAVNLLNFPVAAAYGAGALAASLASGYLNTKAKSYDVGGIIEEDQLANVHKHEGIIPAGIMADAKAEGITIQPLNQNKNISRPFIINLDGQTIARNTMSYMDDEVGLINVG